MFTTEAVEKNEKHVLCTAHFSISLKVFETMKQKGMNGSKFYSIHTFSECLYSRH
jgi:hypothetical protein